MVQTEPIKSSHASGSHDEDGSLGFIDVCGLFCLLGALVGVPALVTAVSHEYIDPSSPPPPPVAPANQPPAAPAPAFPPPDDSAVKGWRTVFVVNMLIALEATVCLVALTIATLRGRQQRKRRLERESQRITDEALQLAGLETAEQQANRNKTAKDAVQGVAASAGLADAKPFVLPGISVGERDPVAAHLEGALAALEAIIFVPKVQPRGVPQQHETRTVEVAALEPAHADQSRGSYWKSATLIVLLVLSVLIAVVALIVSVSLE